MKKNEVVSGLVIGAALFAMFFGAGNMIFPPHLGHHAANEWMKGFWGYFIADIGLAVAAIAAQSRKRDFGEILEPLGRFLSPILMLIIVMCLGPLISIPRTAATTFELSVEPLFENAGMTVFYIVFFACVFIMCINESGVVDFVGKILTPLLFVGLVFLIIKGIISPMGNIAENQSSISSIGLGIEAGYQSMDILGAALFGVLVTESAGKAAGNDRACAKRITIYSCTVAGAGLFIVYMGLTYLGATVSDIYSSHITRTELLMRIIHTLFPGRGGIIFFSIVAGLACLSTAIALTSAAAKYLTGFLKNKLSYRWMVGTICALSAAVSTLGVETLVKFASPVLNTVYPPVIVMIILSFFDRFIEKTVYRIAAVTALVISGANVLSTIGVEIDFVQALPLASYGLSWVVPVMIAAAVGIIWERKGCHIKLI